MSESVRIVDRKRIFEVGVNLSEALEKFRDAKMSEITKQNSWDSWFYSAYYRGDITGRNETERLGVAIELNMDAWAELMLAKEGAKLAEFNLMIARNDDHVVGRLISLESIDFSVKSSQLEISSSLDD